MTVRLASSVSLLAVAYGIAAIANLLLSVTVGRYLGAAALGTFALAVSTARLCYAGTELGLSMHLTRMVARDPSSSGTLVSVVVAFRVAMIPLVIVVSAVIGAESGHGTALLFGLVALAQGLHTITLIYEALLLAHARQRWAALLGIVTSASIAIACALWIITSRGLITFATGYAGAYIAGLTAWILWTGKRLSIWPRLRFDRAAIAAHIQRSWPLGMSVLVSLAALRFPVFVLGVFTTSKDVGAFTAVEIFVTAGAVFQAAITSATFPSLAATYRTQPEKFRSAFWRVNLVLAIFGVLLAVFLTVFGYSLTSWLFPSRDFGLTRELMPIVAWSTPALLLVHHNVLMFAAADQERSNLRSMVVWLVIIAACQLAFVPFHGVIGAGWALLLGRTLGLCALAAALFAAKIHRGGAPTTAG